MRAGALRPAAMRPGYRAGGIRRTRGIRRASAGLRPVRAGALLVLLAGIGVTWGLASSDVFTIRDTTIDGATWTAEDAILSALAIPVDANAFTLGTVELADRVGEIPAIAAVSVRVQLPGTVRVAVTERRALLVWRVGTQRFLVDADGVLFASLGAEPPEAAAKLPVIIDARTASIALDVGQHLDPVTLDAALRLGSLTPVDVGSEARSLVLRLDDQVGYAMRTRPASWTAIFGFYTPTLRTTDIIPGQVRLLRSLLAGREAQVRQVILADDHSGTYIPRDTPEPTKQPKGSGG